MRIAIWWEQDAWGGVDTHLLTLLRNWPGNEDQFVIFYNRNNQGMSRIQASLKQINGVTIEPFDDLPTYLPSIVLRVVRYFSLPIRFWFMKRRAQNLLTVKGEFDALFADNGGYPGAWGSLAAVWAGAALGLRVRLLLVHHSAIARSALRYSVESLIDLGVQMWATDLVTVSRATRDSLIERRGFFTERNPIRVIHNGVDQSLQSQEVTVNLRKQLGIPADSFLIGMVGRLERYKGQEDLILSLCELPPEMLEQVVAVFVGGGDIKEMERLKLLGSMVGVASQIRFAGYVDVDTSVLMRQFDLLAMLTKDFEGFGLTIAEAMAAGTPVLTTNVGAVSEFVSTELAVLIPPEAPEEIAAALVQIIAKREDAQHRAARAKLHIRKFSGQIMAKRFHRLFVTSGVTF